jgi:hypothetical protein
MLVAFDEMMMKVCEGGYLWLYDRTGVWLGTVAAGLLALSAFGERLAGRPLDLFGLFLYGMFGLLLVAGQKTVPHRIWNAMVERIRRLAARRVIWLLMSLLTIALVLLGAVAGAGVAILSDLSVPVAMYLLLTRFRDRRPPPQRRAFSDVFGSMAVRTPGRAG